MPVRHGFSSYRTHRPDPASTATAVLPTIADVLRLDAVTVAAPEVLVGGPGLERPVRWVHVTETDSVAGLVSGGELLLSTGVGWPHEDRELERYAQELCTTGVAGLVLELGAHYRSAPQALVDACAVRGIPLIVLHAQARFIAITEAVHSRIITDQMNALRARDDIHALFTELSLRGSPAEFIVAQLARTLGVPVVLEDLTHRVVAAETHLAGDGILATWEQDSRAAHREHERGEHGRKGNQSRRGAPSPGATDWLIVPVEARGTCWGYLIALPGQAHPAGRLNVLEQGAVALALNRLADTDANGWVLQSHHSLLSMLLGGRYQSEPGLLARFEASGLPITGRRLFGIALTTRSLALTTGRIRDAALQIGAEALVAVRPDAEPSAPKALLAALSLPATRAFDDHALAAFVTHLRTGAGPGAGTGSRSRNATQVRTLVPDVTLSVGTQARDIRSLLASLDEATELLDTGTERRTGKPGVTIIRAENRPLLRLVASLAGDPRLQAHTEQLLRPLIEYDLTNDGDLLEVLAAYVAHPGNRTRAAADSHLSRSVFYQRIALIENLLGADLDDGETVSALHTALLARRRIGGH